MSICVPQGCERIVLKLQHPKKNHVLAQGTFPVSKIVDVGHAEQSVMLKRKDKGKKHLSEDPSVILSFLTGMQDAGAAREKSPVQLLEGVDLDSMTASCQLQLNKRA